MKRHRHNAARRASGNQPPRQHTRPLQVMDVMKRATVVISPRASLQEAARKMNVFGVRMLPVCDADKMIGVLTLRDLTMRATAQGRDPVGSTVREVMTREAAYCFEGQTVREAEGIMRTWYLPHLFVVDRRKHLKGVVSLGDLKGNHPERNDRSKHRNAKQNGGYAHEIVL